MNRKRQLLTDWKMLCAFLLVIGAGLTVMYLQAGEPPYRFLKGHKPIYTRIDSDGTYFTESQGFSWDAKFEDVNNQAWAEFEAIGYHRSPRRTDADRHYRYPAGNSPTVSIYARRISKYEDVENFWRADVRPHGVTVIVNRVLPDNWLTRFRKWLQR